MKSVRSVVLQVLAHHLGRPSEKIHLWHDLERDLDMTPLELVLVALDIEGIEDVDLDVVGLEHARTVGELATFFTREVEHARRGRVALDVA
jgi:hypothetical protein